MSLPSRSINLLHHAKQKYMSKNKISYWSWYIVNKTVQFYRPIYFYDYFNNISNSSQTYCRLPRSPLEIILWRLMMTTKYNIYQCIIFRAGWQSEMCYLTLVSCLQQVWWGFAVFLQETFDGLVVQTVSLNILWPVKALFLEDNALRFPLGCSSSLLSFCGVAICLIKALEL